MFVSFYYGYYFEAISAYSEDNQISGPLYYYLCWCRWQL